VSKNSSICQTSPIWLKSISSKALLQLFDKKSGLEEVLAWLISLKTSKVACKQLAQNSVANNNGFVKIRLALGREDEPDIRLHVWQKDQRAPTDFHNHPWDFVTLVLRGGLEHEICDMTEGASFAMYRYETRDPLDLRVQNIGSSNLEPLLNIEAVKGTTIKYKRTLIHRVRKTSSQIAMSIVARYKFEESYSLIFRPQGCHTPTLQPSMRLSESATETYVASAVQALEKLI
jgi:hypothetical protein